MQSSEPLRRVLSPTLSESSNTSASTSGSPTKNGAPPPINHHTRRSASISYSLSSPTNSSNSHSQNPFLIDPNPTTIHRRTSVPAIVIPTSTSHGNHRRKASVANLNGLREEEEEESDVILPLSSSALPSSSSSAGFTPLTASFPRTGADRAHARNHSRIHERNLSVFFPQPGQPPAQMNGYRDYDHSRSTVSSASPISESVNGGASSQGGNLEQHRSAPTKRTGHHHKHSLSHNLFPLIDPSASHDPNRRSSASIHSTSPHTPLSAYSIKSPSPFVSHAPHSTHQSTIAPIYTSLPSFIRFIVVALRYLPLSTKVGLLLSIGQIVLGASLWITGQSGESLSVTGLGYLVVFDGIGGLSSILVEGGKGVEEFWELLGSPAVESSVRLPFGNQRLVTLSHFSQAIYLLFSAVYVCKESIEHVLLLHGPNEVEGSHGVGHGGMGHGEGLASISNDAAIGIALPVVLLSLSAALSLISSISLRNHQSLSRTVGRSTFSFSAEPSSNSSLVSRIGNPFTLTVLIFSIGLAASAFTIPGLQLAPLDKVVALLQSVAMFYIAYPAAVATGQILLQTAPLSTTNQMMSLANGLRDIENHPQVLSIAPPHIWQLAPAVASAELSKTHADRRGSSTSNSPALSSSKLIATLSVTVAKSTSDVDILAITRFCTERLASGLRLNQEQRRRGSIEQSQDGEEGELTVMVVRDKHGSSDHQSHVHEHHQSNSHASHDHHDHSGHSHHH